MDFLSFGKIVRFLVLYAVFVLTIKNVAHYHHKLFQDVPEINKLKYTPHICNFIVDGPNGNQAYFCAWLFLKVRVSYRF